MTPTGDFRPDPANERYIVLQMVQDGTISPDDGARLLEAMDRSERTDPAPQTSPASPKLWDVRILITDANGKKDVDLTVPLGLVEMGLNLTNRFAPGKVPYLTDIMRSVHDGVSGTVASFESDTDHIEIIIQERNDHDIQHR